MGIVLHAPMTMAEFLDWEDGQEVRHEFDGMGPVAMPDVTALHATMQANLIAALAGRLRGRPCQVYGSRLRMEVAQHIRYADALVVCTPVAASATVIRNPAVVFAIVSGPTMLADLAIKNADYRATPSVKRYVALLTTGTAAIAFSRRHGEWVTDLFATADAKLPMPEIGIDLPLADIYEGVPFEEGEV